jgi:hypothetical protein
MAPTLPLGRIAETLTGTGANARSINQRDQDGRSKQINCRRSAILDHRERSCSGEEEND